MVTFVPLIPTTNSLLWQPRLSGGRPRAEKPVEEALGKLEEEPERAGTAKATPAGQSSLPVCPTARAVVVRPVEH